MEARKASDVHQFNISLAEKEVNAVTLCNTLKEVSLTTRNLRKKVTLNCIDVTSITNNSTISTLSRPLGEPATKKIKMFH